ncbi:hypothetical protein [Pseudoteredinibacter isoporae]|uniref:Uncharacterized protein n=1 Tax=Pseudoteredinibacter isoporae TaxID=570281 RepID=A0A7X0JTH0_9GAMM|nr:hypothetical protein [Pseudoteredinibacter isoporae]MBB6521096.1 hypothetical protein [Pseudoteredinibacter isoporae]NHO86660.1 hypothetical protein [Pseudoteredinibacter isoporae]NIB24888.1 hypothetical protein [Pseudoteredinibacter isoporae]
MNKLKRYKLVQTIFLLFCLCFFSSCTSFHEEIDNLGEFYYKVYIKEEPFRLHGTGRGAYKREVCSKTQNKCWEGAKLMVWHTKSPRYSEVMLGMTYIVDGKTGLEVNCKNCLNEKNRTSEWAFNAIDYPRWNKDNSQVLIAGLNKETGSGELFLLELNDGVGKKTQLKTYKSENGEFIKPKKVLFSPNGEGVAWLSCSPICTLIAYNIPSGVHTETKTPCTLKQNLSVKWVGGRAVPSHRKAARNYKDVKYICAGEDGKPLYEFNESRFPN